MGTGSDGRLELCRRVWVLAWFWQSQAGSVTLAPLAWVPLQGCGPPNHRLTKSQLHTPYSGLWWPVSLPGLPGGQYTQVVHLVPPS